MRDLTPGTMIVNLDVFNVNWASVGCRCMGDHFSKLDHFRCLTMTSGIQPCSSKCTAVGGSSYAQWEYIGNGFV